MPSTSRLLPEHIVCKITQRDNIRRANPCDPALKPLNLEITSDISLHKQNLWKVHLNANWDHRHNTHTLWKTIHGLCNRAAPTPQNCTITFNKKIATSPKNIVNCFNKQFTNTKHGTHKLSAWPEVRGTADTDGGAYSPFRSILLVLTHDFIIIQLYGPACGD